MASSWTEQVAMLKSAPVEVLEPLVLRILNDPMWSGRRLTSSQVGDMLAELVHAVPDEVALKLVKRLEAEDGVSIIQPATSPVEKRRRGSGGMAAGLIAGVESVV